MTVAYVVVGSSGQYSDHSEWNVCVCLDAGKAQEIANGLNELSELLSKFNQRLYDEFEQPYRKAHPVPVMPIHPDNSSIRHYANAKQTGKNRNKYDVARQRYKVEYAAFEKAVGEWTMAKGAWEAAFEIARKDWIANNRNLPEHLVEFDSFDQSFNSDAEYDVDECVIVHLLA